MINSKIRRSKDGKENQKVRNIKRHPWHNKSAHGKAQGMTRLLNQLNAYLKGKNVVLTMPTKDTNRRFIRINAKDVWGDLHAKQQAQQN